MKSIIMLVHGMLYHACILVVYHKLHMLGSHDSILRVGNCIKEHKILAITRLSIDGSWDSDYIVYVHIYIWTCTSKHQQCME